jgi:hypothetical protein
LKRNGKKSKTQEEKKEREKGERREREREREREKGRERATYNIIISSSNERLSGDIVLSWNFGWLVA